MIYSYNQGKFGVDLHNQLRSYYSVHVKAERNWWRLFGYILDTALCNAYIIHKTRTGPKSRERLSHAAFQREVVLGLCKRETDRPVGAPVGGVPVVGGGKRRMTRQHHDLPHARLVGHHHFPVYGEKSEYCEYCRYKMLVSGKKVKYTVRPRTSIKCEQCDVYLCIASGRDCFKDYHTK
jgi:hypothetical protein